MQQYFHANYGHYPLHTLMKYCRKYAGIDYRAVHVYISGEHAHLHMN